MRTIKVMCCNEKGFTTTFFALMMPLFIAILGFCVDGSILIYQRMALETSSDAASRSAIDAYDRDIWVQQHIVVLHEDQATEIVEDILHMNSPNAKLVSLEVPVNNPSECIITTEMEVPTFFLKIFTYNSFTVRVKSTAHGY